MKIPEPRFLIFYNGQDEQPDRQMLRLSDLYITKSEKPELELEALMLNVNKGHNQELMVACRSLREYAEYVDWVRRFAKEMSLDQAVDRAIDTCIHKGILAEFLEKNKAEVKKVSIYEYDEEEHMRMEREESELQGKIKMLIENYREFGKSSEDIIAKLMERFQMSREEAEKYVEEEN